MTRRLRDARLALGIAAVAATATREGTEICKGSGRNLLTQAARVGLGDGDQPRRCRSCSRCSKFHSKSCQLYDALLQLPVHLRSGVWEHRLRRTARTRLAHDCSRRPQLHRLRCVAPRAERPTQFAPRSRQFRRRVHLGDRSQAGWYPRQQHASRGSDRAVECEFWLGGQLRRSRGLRVCREWKFDHGSLGQHRLRQHPRSHGHGDLLPWRGLAE